MQMSIAWLPSRSYTRLKEATVGFAVTTLPLAAIEAGQLLIARYTVLVVGGMNPDVDTWAVTQYRGDLTCSYAVVACVVAAYWLLTAGLSRGHFLAVRSANVTLALGCFAFGCAMGIVSSVPEPTIHLKGACPYLDLPDVNLNFGFDVPTACEAFAHRALQILLLGLPALLLGTSAFLRISKSRYRQ